MRLREYLDARGEPELRFAKRSGLSQAAVHSIANHDSADPRISTCTKIVVASREQPAPNGGTVTWEGLHPQGNARRKGRTLSRKRKR